MRHLAFNLKTKQNCQTLTDDTLDIKAYPLLLIWLESWNHTMQGMIEVYKFWEKCERPILCEINCAAWLVKNGQTVFSKFTQKTYLTWSEQTSKQVDSSFPLWQILFTFWLVISGKYVEPFILGNCLLDMNFDFYWNLALQLSCITLAKTFRHHFSFSIG